VDQAGTHTYAYDELYRLTSVTYPGPSTTTYAFDAFGNRTSMTVGTDETTYTYDDADRLTSVDPPGSPPAVSYTWDDNGSLTARGGDSFAWDYEERMTSATVNSVTTTFAYRGDGLRDSRTTGMATTTFTWDIAAGLPVVIDDGNRYVYGAGLEAMVDGGDPYYYLADGLGSTMAIVDDTGAVQRSYTYDVYGKPTASGALTNEFDFAGQQTDPTGLQYLRARYMDPETGIFLSRDHMNTHPAWLDNSFSYTAANPIRFVDPRGLERVEPEKNAPFNESWRICMGGPPPGEVWIGPPVEEVCPKADDSRSMLAGVAEGAENLSDDIGWARVVLTDGTALAACTAGPKGCAVGYGAGYTIQVPLASFQLTVDIVATGTKCGDVFLGDTSGKDCAKSAIGLAAGSLPKLSEPNAGLIADKALDEVLSWW
jgi:RHS repeat-associated protein